jgi:RNA polymerase sigma-70 factor (ECF subfamily)
MTTAPQPDQELMLAFQRGSVAAFEELFRRYEQPIWGYFRRRLADPARAEELTQDTFLAILRGAERYEPRATFRTYLYTIAFNLLCADRRAARPWTGAEPEANVSVRPSVENDLWLRQALGRLDDDDRAVLMLREFEQLSYAEIAVVLGVPINTVRSRLFRAREALRVLLAPAHALQGQNS